MKKIFVLCCLLGMGIFGGASDSSAAAYVGDTDSIKVDPEANKKAIEILKDSGELEDTRFPLDKLTYETPTNVNSSMFSRGYSNFKLYRQDDFTRIYGIWQIRCNVLAPVGFSWLDNGIPMDAVTYSGNNQFNFSGKTLFIADSGVGLYDQGYYWRKINTKWGSFWASVWNIQDLVYS